MLSAGLRPVRLLAVASLIAAVVAEVLIRAQGLAGATHLVGLGLLYLAWWIALTGAASRVSGSPVRWFTVAAPLSAGALVFAAEVAIAVDAASVGEALSGAWFPLMVVAPVVTILWSRRERSPWKSGLVAWSLLLFQAAVSVSALSGIPFGTFGTESRADELMFFAVIPPLIALLVAGVLAPGLGGSARVACVSLVALAVPAVLSSTSDGGPGLILAVVAIGSLLVIVDTIGRSADLDSSSLGDRVQVARPDTRSR